MKPTLIVMLKEARVGRVKTRLGRDIGKVDATWWFRHQSRRLLRQIADPRWETVLAVTPYQSLTRGNWPVSYQRWDQGSGDLGERMLRLLGHVDRGPACLIGADIPGVTRRHIADAFKSLGRHDAVFGPAEDGGYWLIGLKGMRAVHPKTLSDVRWSTQYALQDSVAALPFDRIGRVATLRDVDTAADLP